MKSPDSPVGILPHCRVRRAAILLPLLAVLGCGQGPAPVDGNRVFVTIVPQAYLVERIGGDRIEVDVMVPPGQAEETYEPTPQQMTRLAGAHVYFSIGVQFEEALLPKIERNLPRLRIVDASAGIKKREIEEHSHDHGEDHGHEHSHDHGMADPHIWLDPVLMIQQAEIVARVLSETFPDASETFTARLGEVKAELESLNAELAALLEPHKGKSVFVFHPSYGYFCDRYGLVQVPVESAGKEPTSREFVELVKRAKAEQVRTLFIQPQFSSGAARNLAQEIGAEVETVDHLAYDYADNLRGFARKIAASLEVKSATP